MFAKIQLIVGLGNPGPDYVRTRHNVGMWFVDALSKQYQATWRSEKKFYGNIAKIETADFSCWLLKPTTYMNDSGQSVLSFAHFYKIRPESILIIHDELDFEPGIIRIKAGGGHGGHNGLRDIIQHLKSHDFYRLRLGIGHPGSKDRVTPYVLATPSPAEHDKISQSIAAGLSILPNLVLGDIDKACRALHKD